MGSISPPGYPIWDSNTDSVTISVRDSASGSGVVAQQVVVPDQCYWMILNVSGGSSGTNTPTFYISTDEHDIDGGIAVEDGAGGTRVWSQAVAPGGILYLSSDGEDVAVTITRFYNKP